MRNHPISTHPQHLEHGPWTTVGARCGERLLTAALAPAQGSVQPLPLGRAAWEEGSKQLGGLSSAQPKAPANTRL